MHEPMTILSWNIRRKADESQLKQMGESFAKRASVVFLQEAFGVPEGDLGPFLVFKSSDGDLAILIHRRLGGLVGALYSNKFFLALRVGEILLANVHFPYLGRKSSFEDLRNSIHNLSELVLCLKGGCAVDH